MGPSRGNTARAAVDLTFEELYRGHRADVYRDALRELGNEHDAEDVTQAAFVDAYKAVLRGTRPQSPRAWLLAISENVRRRRFRTAQRRPREEALDADFPVSAEVPTERAHALAEGLASLPPEQRRVFVLREISGHSYDEIADEVGSTVASVQMLLFRARRSLREQLEPPVVARRRTGSLVPVPGWLASLASRLELAGLTPRAAGATGATALVVLGASVAVPKAPADVPRTGATAAPTAAAAASSSSETGRQLSARGAPTADPVPPTIRAHVRLRGTKSVAATASVPVMPSAPGAGTPVPTVTPQPEATEGIQTITADPVTQAGAAAAAAELPKAAPVALPAPVAAPVGQLEELTAQPPLPVSVPVPVQVSVPSVPAPPPLPTPGQVVAIAAGAAGAAGADAPPLPLPSLPPVALPRTP
jgi:RNA polymerase sigma-70 factor, ECF subfamily